MRSFWGFFAAWLRRKEIESAACSWTLLHAQSTNALSSGFPLSQGNPEAVDRCGGKTKHPDFLLDQ